MTDCLGVERKEIPIAHFHQARYQRLHENKAIGCLYIGIDVFAVQLELVIDESDNIFRPGLHPEFPVRQRALTCLHRRILRRDADNFHCLRIKSFLAYGRGNSAWNLEVRRVEWDPVHDRIDKCGQTTGNHLGQLGYFRRALDVIVAQGVVNLLHVVHEFAELIKLNGAGATLHGVENCADIENQLFIVQGSGKARNSIFESAHVFARLLHEDVDQLLVDFDGRVLQGRVGSAIYACELPLFQRLAPERIAGGLRFCFLRVVILDLGENQFDNIRRPLQLGDQRLLFGLGTLVGIRQVEFADDIDRRIGDIELH